jgi:hypothetical protein
MHVSKPHTDKYLITPMNWNELDLFCSSCRTLGVEDNFIFLHPFNVISGCLVSKLTVTPFCTLDMESCIVECAVQVLVTNASI